MPLGAESDGAALLPDGRKLSRLVGRLAEPEAKATRSLGPCRPPLRRTSHEPTPGVDPIAHGDVSVMLD